MEGTPETGYFSLGGLGWKELYCRGGFNNEPTQEGALRDRIEKLERLVSNLPLKNGV